MSAFPTSLRWLPVNFRVQFKVLMLALPALHGLAPKYLLDLLQAYQTTRPLRSSQTLLLKISKSRLKSKGDCAFCAASPHLWDSLPLDIRCSAILGIFKSRLRAHSLALMVELALDFTLFYCCLVF